MMTDMSKWWICFYFLPFQQSPLLARSDVFVYPTGRQDVPQDCYDMPRSLHPLLARQDSSSNYQSPRPHRPSEAAAFADYDVPRQHNQPTASIDRFVCLFGRQGESPNALRFHYDPLFSGNRPVLRSRPEQIDFPFSSSNCGSNSSLLF